VVKLKIVTRKIIEMTINELKKEIGNLIRKTSTEVFGQEPTDIALIFPPNVKLGDLAFECFDLAKQTSKSPAEIALQIAEKIRPNEVIERITAVGQYVNFKINRAVLFSSVLEATNGQIAAKNINNKIMVEYLSPNTNKPLHLGHLRNGALGMAVSNILEANGQKVIKANLVNDRGVHICKSMLAWQKWGQGATPQSTNTKGDHFVGQWYVRYAIEAEKNPDLEQEVQDMLKKWETGDPETIKLWETMNDWVYEGFKATYGQFGLQFDVMFYESQTYKLGKDIVQQGIDKGLFKQTENGSVITELPTKEFGLDKDDQPKKITLLREDGTSVYITQDLGTAVLKFKEHNLNESIYVVGSEQNYHFRVLFKLLEMLGYSWAKNCHHLSYGMVYLPEGKMKSREGKVVDADDLISQMEKLARIEIETRLKVGTGSDPVPTPQEIEERAHKIALSAIKFYLLRVGAEQDIHFNPQESLSFDGFTGPYCQYAYARAKSILQTANPSTRFAVRLSSPSKPRSGQAHQLPTSNIDYSLLGNEAELLLAQKLMAFPEVIANAGQNLKPSKIALYVYDLAKAFNQFYQKHSVLKADNSDLAKARLKLVEAVANVIKKSLNLIGVDTLEEM